MTSDDKWMLIITTTTIIIISWQIATCKIEGMKNNIDLFTNCSF